MKSLLPVVLAAFVLTGCIDQKAWIQKFVPKDDDALARRFIESVRNKRYDEAKVMLAPEIRGGADNDLQKMQAVVDHGAPQSSELIACFTNYSGSPAGKSTKQVDLTYQIHFTNAWTLVEVVVRPSNEGHFVAGAHFNALPTSLEFLNRFTVENKTPIHLVFLVACIAGPLFIIVTVVVCLFSRVRRRWLWIIFILFGLTQFQLNWTSGQTEFRPISFLLLGASFFRAGLYAPIVFSFGIPLGALVFLALRRWLLIKDDSSGAPAPPIDSPSPGQEKSA
jgi:hypothetical protein